MKIVVYNPIKNEDMDLCDQLKRYSLQNSRDIRIFYIGDARQLLVKTDYFDCALLYSGSNSQKDLSIIEEFENGHGDCPVILFSEDSETVKDTLYLRPHRYLTTPIDYSMLREALDSFYAGSHSYDNVIIKSNRSTYQLSIRKIMYLEAKEKYCDIVSKDETLTVNKMLKDVESQLPSINFFRPHRSFYVNLEHVEGYTHSNVFLTDGTVLPLSKYRYRDMICAYESFIKCNRM